MTTKMIITGLLATLVIMIVIPVYSWLEPEVQEFMRDEFRTEALTSATVLYAENCAICHGAAGEGIASSPALNLEALANMPAEDLFKVISRGRDNTQMAAWALDEGGIFTNAQAEDLATLVQHVNWDYVNVRVNELGLTPPQVIELEVSEEMLTLITSLPDSENLTEGLRVYAESCAACHNSNASGTLIGPALDTPDVRATPIEDLVEIVSDGVNGTFMAGWENSLSVMQIESVLDLILRWPEVVQAGVEFPEVELVSIPTSPERIAEGEQLFRIACKACHGSDAYGSPMAPALNNVLFLDETPDAAIYQIIAGGVPGTLMPAWGNRLTDYDIQTLVAYLRSFEPSAPPILSPILD